MPHAPDESPLIRAVRYLDELKMPPKQKLSAAEIAALERWVAVGCPLARFADGRRDRDGIRADRRTASLVGLPARPDRPAAGRHRPARAVANEIDAFLLEALRSQGITPAPPADRRTWIRRATFDLTGLPPTPDEVAAFVADRFGRGVREGRRSAPGLAGLRPALGAALARRGPLRRLLRRQPEDAHGQLRADRGLALSRLGRRCVQPRPARSTSSSSTRSPATCCRSRTAGEVYPAGLIATTFLSNGVWDRGDADKEKIVSDMVDDQIDTVGKAFLGPDARLCPLPRPQVRPDLAAGLLRPGRHLLQHAHPQGPGHQGRRVHR